MRSWSDYRAFMQRMADMMATSILGNEASLDFPTAHYHVHVVKKTKVDMPGQFASTTDFELDRSLHEQVCEMNGW